MSNMKTSLVLEDSLYNKAKQAALKTGKSISEIISLWARIGMEASNTKKRSKNPILNTVDLGDTSLIDLSSRRDWMDSLD